MSPSWSLAILTTLATWFCCGCVHREPLRTLETPIPAGMAAVYVYSFDRNGVWIYRENKALGDVPAGHYKVDFTWPGTNHYWIENDELFEFPRPPLRPTRIRVEPGERYYLRLIENVTLLRIEPAKAREEIAWCIPDE